MKKREKNMNNEELRSKLFSEMENMSKEDMIKELEEAGYIIRYDLKGSGVISVDDTSSQPSSTIGFDTYTAKYPNVCNDFVAMSGASFVSINSNYSVYMNPNNQTYSSQYTLQWVKETKGVMPWTTNNDLNLKKAS